MKGILILVTLLYLFNFSKAGLDCPSGSFYYNFTFHATWSNEVFEDVPEERTIASLIIVTHSYDYTLWQNGGFPSELFADYVVNGNSKALMDNIENNKIINGTQVIGFYDKLPIVQKNGNVSVDFYVNRATPYLSFVARIEDSPDWFIGASNIDLCNHETGEYIREIDMNLFAMDAGLYDAKEWYKLGDAEVCPINVLDPSDAFHNYCDKKPYHKLEEIGFVEMKLKEQPNCATDKDQNYKIKWDGEWTCAKFAPSPCENHFVKTVIINHNSSIQIFKPGNILYEPVLEYFKNDRITPERDIENTFGIRTIMYVNKTLNGGDDYHFVMKATPIFPLITFVTYLNTSPDWFAGFYDLNLCGEDGWRNDIDFDAYTYKAGYNEACTFNSPAVYNAVIQPVTLLEGSQNFYNSQDMKNTTLPAIAYVHVDKTNENAAAGIIPTLLGLIVTFMYLII